AMLLAVVFIAAAAAAVSAAKLEQEFNDTDTDIWGCWDLNVDNAVVTYSCSGEIIAGCLAEIICKDDLVIRSPLFPSISYRKYECVAEQGWVDMETRTKLSDHPIESCVAPEQ
ncbi:hypothetical protein PMAYCL1PPCAC_10663, partial [Pristionchus mayeri]